jgi:hypothetical protein
MASGALERKHRFKDVGHGFPGAKVDGSRDGSWSHCCFIWLYLATKPTHVGADVDGLAFFLYRPTVYHCQTRGQSFLTGATPSHHATLGGGAFPGGAKPPILEF